MRKSRFTEEQIAYALRQVEAGMPAAQLCRKMGISEQTFYLWRRRSGGILGGRAKPANDGRLKTGQRS